MDDLTQLTLAWTYWKARLYLARSAGARDERGASAPEYLVLLIGIITIAGLAIFAVTRYVTNKGNQLNGR